MLNKCIRRYFFPSRAKEAKKQNKKITPDLRLCYGLHECPNYLEGGGGLGGSEKNRGTVITSLQLAFSKRDRNFTPFTIH